MLVIALEKKALFLLWNPTQSCLFRPLYGCLPFNSPSSSLCLHAFPSPNRHGAISVMHTGVCSPFAQNTHVGSLKILSCAPTLGLYSVSPPQKKMLKPLPFSLSPSVKFLMSHLLRLQTIPKLGSVGSLSLNCATITLWTGKLGCIG